MHEAPGLDAGLEPPRLQRRHPARPDVEQAVLPVEVGDPGIVPKASRKMSKQTKSRTRNLRFQYSTHCSFTWWIPPW